MANDDRGALAQCGAVKLGKAGQEGGNGRRGTFRVRQFNITIADNDNYAYLT